jgi:hypothetical protein
VQEHGAEADRAAIHEHEFARHRHWPLAPERPVGAEGLAAAAFERPAWLNAMRVA